MLQQETADDYVVATGESYSIKEMVNYTFRYIFGEDILWSGTGLDEIGQIYIGSSLQTVVRIDKEYFRPNEVDILIGDATKAKNKLQWLPTVCFYDILQEMIDYEMIP